METDAPNPRDAFDAGKSPSGLASAVYEWHGGAAAVLWVSRWLRAHGLSTLVERTLTLARPLVCVQPALLCAQLRQRNPFPA